MTDNTINLANRRPPVTYSITITHHWDDRLEVFVEGVSDDERSQAAVSDALARVAEGRMNAKHIHRAMLARINSLMHVTEGPELAELSALASACQAYEEEVYPITAD